MNADDRRFLKQLYQDLEDKPLQLADGNPAVAKEHYLEALPILEQTEEKLLIGLMNQRLATVTQGEEREAYLAKARAAWESIGRHDLVATLEKLQTPPAASPT